MIPPLSNNLTTQHGETAATGGGLTPLSSLWTTARTYSTCWVPLEGAIQYWLDSAAAQHWSLVVTLLDTLSIEQQQTVPADELSRIRALSQAARAQQARLDKLAEEVLADLAAAAQQAATGGVAAPRSARPQQQEGRTWPNA